MVDLAAPRAPAMGNPRFHASDADLNTRFANESSTNLAMPIRPSTATRPGTASSKVEYDNPFRVHFGGKESISSRPETPMTVGPFEDFEFGLQGPRDTESGTQTPTGYPSPPPSINNTERPFSPSHSESSRRNAPTSAPSGLRNVDTAGPMGLPSPAASVSRPSEDHWDPPVIRNVQAKRDTLTFHTPRRQSFAMELEASSIAAGSRTPLVDGLAGNFTAFDFGETVRRSSISNGSLDMDGGVSPTTDVKPRGMRTASSLRAMQSSPSLSDASSGRTRNTSDAMSPLSTVSTAESLVDKGKTLQPVQIQGTRPVSPMRAPQPSPLSQAQTQSPPPRSPAHQSFQQSTHQRQPQQSQPHYHPFAQAQFQQELPAPSLPPTTPIPPPPTQKQPRPANAPSATAGAHPGYMSRPLDPPPSRVFRSRVGSDAHARPLRVPAPLVDRAPAPRSPYGPPVDQANYLRSERSAPEPRSQSPFSRPMEGNFPVSKGLPRGRRPQHPEEASPETGISGLGPRKERRQKPTYPPARNELQPEMHPRFDSNPPFSAVPPPLSPFRTDPPLSPMPPPRSPPKESSWPVQYTTSPISPKPPSLPSPSFSSLQNYISSSSETLAKSFEIAADGNFTDNAGLSQPIKTRPLISPVMADFVPPRDSSGTRLEAKKAPPRPNPATVPPSLGVGSAPERARTPNLPVDQFNPGFI